MLYPLGCILDYISLCFLLMQLRIEYRILDLFELWNEVLICCQHRLKYGFLRSFFFLFVLLLRNICLRSRWWIHFHLKQLFHHWFDDWLIFICLILVILMLIVFERIFGVLCNVVPFLSVDTSVFHQIIPINLLFVCMCFWCRFSLLKVWIMQVVWSHALKNGSNIYLTQFLSI